MSKLSEQELMSQFTESLGDLYELDLPNQEAEIKIYKTLAKVDGIHKLLRDTMVKDMRRYFAAQDDRERHLIYGAFSRTSYLYSRIVNLTDM